MERVKEVSAFLEDNDVKFIRLAFTDIFGVLKNISVNAKEFEKICKYGAAIDASRFSGFMNIETTDLLLFPDLDTITILPWRPSTGRVVRFYCDVFYPDGKAFEGDSRSILREANEECERHGFSASIASESEFYLFQSDLNGKPTQIPLDNATFMDVAPLDAGENIRREICLDLQQMGIYTKTSYHEKGPGQNAIIFSRAQALTAADNLVTYRNAVKSIAAINGLYASFMPKPLKDQPGSGLRIKISLQKNDRNIFNDEYDNKIQEQNQFIAGILNRIYDISLLLNPISNSYLRIGQMNAPKYIMWSTTNKDLTLRINMEDRIIIRSADNSCNPYLAYALILKAGLAGVENQEELKAVAKKHAKVLPANMEEAIKAFKESEFVKANLPISIIDTYISEKLKEAKIKNHDYSDDDYFKLI